MTSSFEEFAARRAWNRLESYLKRKELTVSMEEIGAKLALAHAHAVRADTINVHHLLSPVQVASYHHDVLGTYGIPKSYFGGTIYGLPANTYSGIWCRGCDNKP